MTRRAELVDLVTGRLKAALLMTPDEELPADRNYFELGLGSLQVIQVKEELEAELGCPIDAAALYGRLTVAAVADYLAERLDGRPAAAPTPTGGPRKDLAAELVRRLHR